MAKQLSSMAIGGKIIVYDYRRLRPSSSAAIVILRLSSSTAIVVYGYRRLRLSSSTAIVVYDHRRLRLSSSTTIVVYGYRRLRPSSSTAIVVYGYRRLRPSSSTTIVVYGYPRLRLSLLRLSSSTAIVTTAIVVYGYPRLRLSSSTAILVYGYPRLRLSLSMAKVILCLKLSIRRIGLTKADCRARNVFMLIRSINQECEWGIFIRNAIIRIWNLNRDCDSHRTGLYDEHDTWKLDVYTSLWILVL